MTDEMQEPTPEPKMDHPAVEPVFDPPALKKSNTGLWVIIGVILAVIAICLCSSLCIAVFGAGMFGVYTEKAPIEAVLDTYMQDMANKNAESAYALFSPRAQRQIPVSKVQELLEGNNYVVFEDYQSLSVSNLNISTAVNTNPDLPQGLIAKVTGVVTYQGGIQGTFNGILEKVDNKWMLYNMYVTVPPSKIK